MFLHCQFSVKGWFFFNILGVECCLLEDIDDGFLEAIDGKIFGRRKRTFGDIQLAPFFGVIGRKEIAGFFKISIPLLIPFGFQCNTQINTTSTETALISGVQKLRKERNNRFFKTTRKILNLF